MATLRRKPLFACFVALLLVVGCTGMPQPTGDIVVCNVNVVTMTSDQVLRDRAVVIENGKVVAILRSSAARKIRASKTVNAEGRYLMPGLADMHTHLGLVLPWDGDPTTESMLSDLSLYLPNGVTMIRNMRATPGILDLRKKLANGDLVGPRLFVSGPSLQHGLPESFGPKIDSRAQAVAAVREQYREGYDLIKVHQDLPTEAYNGVIETAEELGIPVAGHVQGDKPADQSARMSSIEHTEQVAKLIGDVGDFTEAADVLDALIESEVYVTPTVYVFDAIHRYLRDGSLQLFFEQPETDYVSSYWRNAMSAENNFFRKSFGKDYAELADDLEADSKRIRKITAQLHSAGVPLLLGTDAVGLLAPGFSVHQELEMMTETGLSPYEALQTATVNPARWVGLEGESGVVDIGARADLVLLDGNPLENIRATRLVEGIILGGVWIGPEELGEMLRRRLQTTDR